MARKALHLSLIVAIFFCPIWCKKRVCAVSEKCPTWNTCCKLNQADKEEHVDQEKEHVDQECCPNGHDCCQEEPSNQDDFPDDSSEKEPTNKNQDHAPFLPNDQSPCECQGICGGAILEQNVHVTAQVNDALHRVVEDLTPNQLFQQASLTPLPFEKKWSSGACVRILNQSFLL